MKSAIKNKEIEKMKPLDDGEALSVLNTLVKQRKDSVDQFRKGGREELAQKEEVGNQDHRGVPAGRRFRGRYPQSDRGSRAGNRRLLNKGYGKGDEGGSRPPGGQERGRFASQPDGKGKAFVNDRRYSTGCSS